MSWVAGSISNLRVMVFAAASNYPCGRSLKQLADACARRRLPSSLPSERTGKPDCPSQPPERERPLPAHATGITTGNGARTLPPLLGCEPAAKGVHVPLRPANMPRAVNPRPIGIKFGAIEVAGSGVGSLLQKPEEPMLHRLLCVVCLAAALSSLTE